MNNLSSITLVIMYLLVMVAQNACAKEAKPLEQNYYEGYKVPPMEIPSTTKYTHEYVNILGSKMAYVDVLEKATRFYFYTGSRHHRIYGEM